MISAVILTKNEEKNIKSCIDNISFCDEIIVIDDCSIDKTTEIAKNMGAKVFLRMMNKDFSAQSNFGMQKASGDWILLIDADERVSNELKQEIQNSLNNDITVYKFRRIDYIWGRWLKHGESGSAQVVRLVKRNSGKWIRRVHPYFRTTKDVVLLSNPIFHYPHQNVRLFLESINRWSTWHAIANQEECKQSSLVKILFFPLGHFVKNYLFRLGFLDGLAGFVYAVVMSFHSFLAWSKLWIQQKNLKIN
ncbi:hypothetical protein A2863_00945 [Candidatus Woesebacteria bacterium RIFCSPHIGHO2_01_FULL_38_9b]|uniref:Glycosyltransferase 2-like domain-containing protein n=1 Tax=Candidatus Woesebacteria bacterium RIFCSPHIGHO2_01_FULL_38_9b TaxID=1802493 RepID=A0A1F7Y3V7_9BACT|nr:MAG: hypothetical protein A2863_00945 [Candidatus Woesebacteria bacterium RIFCSPHIGHO2_01_FULL_38_9b]